MFRYSGSFTVPSMAEREYGTPLIITGGEALRLSRVSLTEPEHDEGWLQQLLYEHPTLLPIDDIEPVFAPALPLCRELPTGAGSVDVAYISPAGFPTFVETKLWRNLEARREVVAQIIDYAAAIAQWTYDDFVKAVERASGESRRGDALLDAVRNGAEDFDQHRFVDSIELNLARGRFLLLVVGDGIHEGVERMAETLARSAHLGFTLALVELGLYRLPERAEPLIVQPRVVARTREVVRAIVEIRRTDIRPEDVVVTLPEERAAIPQTRRPLTVEAILERIAQNVTPATGDRFRRLLDEIQERGVELVGRESSLALHYIEPGTGRTFSPGFVSQDGTVNTMYVTHYLQKAGMDRQIALDYLETVASLVPGARVSVRERKSGPKSLVRVGSRSITLDELMPRADEWLAAVDKLIARIAAALRDESSRL